VTVGWSRKSGEEAGEGEEVEEWIQELMDLAVVKLCVPLKVCFCSYSLFVLPDKSSMSDLPPGDVESRPTNSQVARE
jgi:hypothetical protein